MYLSNDPESSSATAVIERPVATETAPAAAEPTPAPAVATDRVERVPVVRHPAYRNLMWAR